MTNRQGQIRATILLGLFLLAAPRLRATELWSDEAGEWIFSLNPTAKIGTLLAANPDDPVLYLHDETALALARLRLEASLDHGADWNALVAYDHAWRWSSQDEGGSAGLGILPDTGDGPYRLVKLSGNTVSGDDQTGFHELDRLLIAWHPDWGEVIIGRQAIGLGRGVLFSAVDVFAPFSPLEADREWRRGVDALRVEYSLDETISVEAILVGGESANDAAFLLRWRGYLGDWDAEFIGGQRGRDQLVGAVVSGAVGNAEVHAEAVILRLPDPHPDGSIFGDPTIVPQAVIGGSYVFGVGDGLTLVAEYHYNGLGLRDSDDIDLLAADADFQERLARGDMRVLGRHAIGLQLSYPLSLSLNAGISAIANPRDGSGLVSPTLRWDIGQHSSLSAALFVPFGEQPEFGDIQTEYGANPTSLFLQLAIYY